MPGPWEQYQQQGQPAQPAAGPWTQFQQQPQPAQTTTPTAQPQSWLDRLRTSAGSQTPEQIAAQQRPLGEAKGVVQSVLSTATGLGGIINRYAHTSIEDPAIAKRAMEWAQPKSEQEREGFLAGNLGQIFAGGGPFEDILQALPWAERLSEATKAAKAMGGDSVLSRLLRIGVSTVSDATKTAARAGAEIGGQTYAQTGGDIRAAEQAAIPAAAGGFLFGAIPGAGRQAGRELADWAEAQRAGTQVIAGAPFATRPGTQIRPGQPQLLLRNLSEVTQDPATQAVDAATGNIGRTAVASSMNAANAARAPEAITVPLARRLAAPEPEAAATAEGLRVGMTSGETGGVTIGAAAEPTEITGQQVTFPAGKQQRGTRVVEGPGPGQFNLQQYETGQAPPPTGEGELTQRGSHREPIWQYRTSVRPGSPEPEIPGRTGPGTLVLTADGQALGISRARQQLNTYERILNDPAEVEEMGPQQEARLRQAHADLTEQLRRYDDFAASQPHYAPFDVRGAVANTHSIGDAAAHLKANASQLWTTVDDAAKAAGDSETWTGLRNEEKNIKARMNSTTPSARYDELRQELADVHQRQFSFMDRYRTVFSPQEWEYHRRMFQDGAVLDDLHSFFQSKFNGITRAEEARGVGQRVFQPTGNFNNELENFFSGGYRGSATNRDVLERTIGQGHMDDLKQLGQLWTDSERMEATGSLHRAIASTIKRHYTRPGLLWTEMPAGAATATLATGHALGSVLGLGTPAAIGTIAGTRRYVLDQLATNPRFMRDFVYAVQNQVPPRVGGAILASRLIGAAQEPQGRVQTPTPAAQPAARAEMPRTAPAETPRLRAQVPPNSISFTYQGTQFYRDGRGNFYDSSGAPLQSQYMSTEQQSAMDRAANAQTGGR